MAKQPGFPVKISIDNSAGALKDLSNEVTNWTLTGSRGTVDVSGQDKSGVEKLHLLADGGFTITGPFNPTVDKSHAVLSDLDNVRSVTVAISDDGAAVSSGDPELDMEMLITNYDLSRGADGSLTFTASFVLADGTAPNWGTVA